MKFRLSALMAGLALTNIAFAATELDLRHQSTAQITNKFGSSNTKVSIKRIRSDVDFNGVTHTRIQQTYEGIPVWDATGVIHTPKNKSLNLSADSTMNGIIYDNLEKDLSGSPASIFSTANATKALQASKALRLNTLRLSNATISKEKSSPIIYIDENKQAHRAYLTRFTYASPSEVHSPMAIVDASTQKIYRQWDGIFTSSPQETKALNEARAKVNKMLTDSDNTFPDLYDLEVGGVGGNPKEGEMIYDGAPGNRPALKMKAIDTYYEMIPGNPYKMTLCVLMDTDNEIMVFDVSLDNQLVMDNCMPKTPWHNNVSWLSLDRNQSRWYADQMNEGYSPSLDAFNSAVMVRGLYRDWLNVPALIDEDGNPIKYIMRTHFGRNFDNAFWDGVEMTFGDGGKKFYPLTSVGVTAHEISHGFTQTHSAIDGSNPQMAALHESFSDMAAVAVENYMNGKNSWEIGREITKDDDALRYLDNPPKDGRSIDHMRDFDETEPHAGGGITNKAFYLLATTKGWDTRKAFSVMAKANMHYWNASMTTFSDAACGVVSATKDYGYSVADVRIAFAKVGIDTDNCEVTS